MHSDLSEKILQHLTTCDKVDTLDLAHILNEDHQKVVGSLKSIEAAGDFVKSEPVSKKVLSLTEEGVYVARNGSHEVNVFNFIPAEGITQAEIVKQLQYGKVGFSKAMSNGWIYVDKTANPPLVKKKVDHVDDKTKKYLSAIEKGDNDVPENLKLEFKKRKLLQESSVKSFILSKGKQFSTTIVKLEADLDVEMLSSGMWKNLTFKAYNFDALGAPPQCGYLHPLLKVRSEFRHIFLEMGFSEMPTNNYIESSFWNFDALYVPQQHPARDAHDTFFLSHPLKSYKFPLEYLKRLQKVHSSGGYGSKGYGYDWKVEQAQKNVLRTHTTAVSARMLYKLANQEGQFKPVKYFSIDKVFRNETLDSTHLAEFQQVEGVIADVGLTLGDLIGTLYEFFKKLGITQLEFKPAYNPYTEPSMEIFCFHPGLKKWIEVGNSGVFRPEMLLPMGLPSNVNVIAWGLSLERPTMIKYGINNIRDLVGPKVDMKMVEESSICRLEH